MAELTVGQVRQIIEKLKQSDQLANWADDPKTKQLVEQLKQSDALSNWADSPELKAIVEQLRMLDIGLMNFRWSEGIEMPKFELPSPRPPQVVEHHHYHHNEENTDLTQPEPTEQEIPIPEGKTQYSPENWAAIFLWASKQGTRPDHYEIAQLTGKKYSTVRNEYSKWNRQQK